jgi:hypothetical protein
MSGTHTAVPSMVRTPLPSPVPVTGPRANIQRFFSNEY